MKHSMGDFHQAQQRAQRKFSSFYGSMTVAEAQVHLKGWDFPGAVELDEALRRAWINGRAKDHTALCTLMQSGQWR